MVAAPGISCWRDPSFLMAASLSLPGAAWAFGFQLLPPPDGRAWLFFCLLMPAAEEWVFRGLLQPGLRDWAPVFARQWGGISLANAATSLIFALLHWMVQHSPWGLLVLFPSLLFGYFRERHGHWNSAFQLHSLYNTLFALGALGSVAF